MKKNNKIIIFLFITGFILRFFGIFFNGNQNFDTYREWGYATKTYGLADAFAGGYGPIVYLIMGWGERFNNIDTHNWWIPYKAENLIFEVFILALLLILLKKKEKEILWLYWLNPWFLIPGSWAGFWDDLFGFAILSTVFILDFYKNRYYRFLLGGFAFGVAFCIKPQIVAPLSILGIYFFIFHYLSFKFKDFLKFSAGFLSLPVLFNMYFFLQAKSFTYLFQVYSNFSGFMPYLVNSEINIWHTVTYIIMTASNMKGPIYSLNTTTYPYNIVEKSAYLLYFILIFAFVLKSYFNKTDKKPLFFTKLFAFPFILMPQLLTRSHVYHFYTATLLLIPIIILDKNKKILMYWAISVLIHFYNIFFGYGFGRSIVSPIFLWGDPYISVLGFIQFLAFLGLIKELFASSK